MNESILKGFTITDNFYGYKNKTDITKEDRGVAVSGSQNCIIVDGSKIGNRPGFEYIGGRSTDRYGIQGGGSWKTSTGTQIMWRSYYNHPTRYIEIFYNGAWEILDASITGGGAKYRYTTFWDNTELIDKLILVNGSPNIFHWTGAITTFSSATANTITKEGTTTFGEERFSTTGTRKAKVKDDSGVWREFQYTGGTDTTTLTGVTVDLTAYTISAGAPIFEMVDVEVNVPSATSKNDFVANYTNHLIVFSETSRNVLGSKLNDFSDFTPQSSPRLPGESLTFVLDETPTGAAIAPTGSSLYIQTRNYYYQLTLVDSDDGSVQTISIQPTFIPDGGATNNLAVGNIKNYLTQITNEPTYDLLGNVLNVEGIRNESISDDIKNYMDASSVDEASVSYFKNNSFISIKSSDKFGSNNNLLIRDLQRSYWETPWTIPSLLTFEHNGELYAHDPSMKNTIKLYQGYSDGKNGTIEGAPISTKWFSSWDNFGLPFNQKEFDVMWIDGYITPNTKLKFYLSYDFGAETLNFELLGTADKIVLSTSGGGLGYYSVGSRSLGGRGETLSETGLRRFRGFISIPARPFNELQWSVQSNGVNYRWEINQIGFNVRKLNEVNSNIKIN